MFRGAIRFSGSPNLHFASSFTGSKSILKLIESAKIVSFDGGYLTRTKIFVLSAS